LWRSPGTTPKTTMKANINAQLVTAERTGSFLTSALPSASPAPFAEPGMPGDPRATRGQSRSCHRLRALAREGPRGVPDRASRGSVDRLLLSPARRPQSQRNLVPVRPSMTTSSAPCTCA
jgi:hypothetical protein